ncbi:MAG: hypothetical protein ACI82E_001083, partial [Nonlabens sp.]
GEFSILGSGWETKIVFTFIYICFILESRFHSIKYLYKSR